MKNDVIEYRGKEYPVREIMLTGKLAEEYGDEYPYHVSTTALWDKIENKFYEGNEEAVEIDNSIFFYCEEGFIESNPTDEEIIKHLEENML